MKNIIKLLKLINQRIPGFLFNSITMSLLLGILPLFSMVAPKLIIDEFNGSQRFAVMFGIALIAILFNFINQIISLNALNYYERVMFKFTDELEMMVNEKVLTLPIEMTDSKKIQDKMQLAIAAVWNVFSLNDFLIFASGAIVTAIFSILVLIRLNPIIPLFLIILFLLNRPISQKMKENEKVFQKLAAEDDRVYSFYWNFARDAKYTKDIKIYQAEDLILDKATYHMNRMYVNNHKYFTKNGSFIGAMNVINNFGVVASFVYITIRLINKTISVANFTLYFNSLVRLIEALGLAQQHIASITGLAITLETLFEFLEMEDDYNQAGYIDHIDLDEVEIEFRNVSFKYPTSEDYVLEKCSFVINPGETVALVGKNGAGKSTIVKLLCKFYEPTSGEILLNGVNIQDIKTKYYYEILSPTFQDFRLFPFRIDENVATVPHADIDQSRYVEMNKSFDLLNIKNWIDKLPDKEANYITTLFDDKGVSPSGGLGQKLALARSMYHKGKFFIMDEPTSALDPRSEQEIFENMLAITKDQTSLFISHRLSSTKYADRILVCSDGHIAEDGTHEDLLKADNLYAEMFNTQKELYS